MKNKAEANKVGEMVMRTRTGREAWQERWTAEAEAARTQERLEGRPQKDTEKLQHIAIFIHVIFLKNKKRY